MNPKETKKPIAYIKSSIESSKLFPLIKLGVIQKRTTPHTNNIYFKNLGIRFIYNTLFYDQLFL